MKNKLLIMVIAGMMIFSLVGCGDKNKDKANDGENSPITENQDKDTENGDKDAANASEETTKYKPLDKVGVNDFNKQVVGKFEQLLKDKGFELKVSEKTMEKETQEGICRVKYDPEGNGKNLIMEEYIIQHQLILELQI